MSSPASPEPADAAGSALLPMTSQGGLREAGLKFYRRFGGSRMRSRWTINERGAFRVPESGPVIFAGNHIAWLDGPLLIALSPRPAHALVKAEAFAGFNGVALRIAAQIKTRRGVTHVGSLRTAIKALRAGQCVMIWPEGTRGDGELRSVQPGVGYLALVTGAPVVPVAVFGTRRRNEPTDVKPAKGATIEIMYGDSMRLAGLDWPRGASAVSAATSRIGEHMRAHLAQAKLNSHIGLPGPLGHGDD